MNTDNQKPITKAEIDREIRVLFELLKSTNPLDTLDIQAIKQKLMLLRL